WRRSVMNDLKSAFRQLLKNPGFAAVAVLTLALGIGATTAIFSVVHAVLLRPLPYREPERLMTVMHGEGGPAAAADFLDWKAQNQSFESLVCAEGWMPNLTGRDKPEQLWGLHLSKGTFEMLGVAAMLGRTFTAEECLPGKGLLVVLS